MIQDHSDHGTSKEPGNPCSEQIHRITDPDPDYRIPKESNLSENMSIYCE